MFRAIWKDNLLAESEKVEEVEGDVFFPPDSVKNELLRKSEDGIGGGWKGQGVCYHIVIGDDCYPNGAFSFPEPKPSAYLFDGYIAFGNEVSIEKG